MTFDQLKLGTEVDFMEVQGYLLAHGWARVRSRLNDVDIFRSQRGEVVVPLSREFSDYAASIVDAATRIAAAENRTAHAVLLDLLRPGSDVLRFARSDEGTEDGSLGLEEGAMFLNGVRRSLLASACSVESPGRRYFTRLGHRTPAEFVDSCRLGQTERGSFVLTVMCPLNVTVDERPRDGFGRLATSTLMGSIQETVLAIRRGEFQDLADAEHPPITANLCDALVEMMPADESSDLRVRATWSAKLATPQATPATVEIARDLFPRFEDLGAKLRPPEEGMASRFLGRVKELHGEDNELGQLEGEVILDLLLSNGELVRARCDLGPNDYPIAIDAHRRQRYIGVRGILRRRPRRSVLEQPSNVGVVE